MRAGKVAHVVVMRGARSRSESEGGSRKRPGREAESGAERERDTREMTLRRCLVRAQSAIASPYATSHSLDRRQGSDEHASCFGSSVPRG